MTQPCLRYWTQDRRPEPTGLSRTQASPQEACPARAPHGHLPAPSLRVRRSSDGPSAWRGHHEQQHHQRELHSVGKGCCRACDKGPGLERRSWRRGQSPLDLGGACVRWRPALLSLRGAVKGLRGAVWAQVHDSESGDTWMR
uniref:Uncharacterized protein n=1 Tax=Pipistrellus kuhlii TaxID=59472 RepID=A0A7J7WDS5_PIPKU|nr:hypothetical protein mPipKuh1_008003 [Pipistrellus kuhlii]